MTILRATARRRARHRSRGREPAPRPAGPAESRRSAPRPALARAVLRAWEAPIDPIPGEGMAEPRAGAARARRASRSTRVDPGTPRDRRTAMETLSMQAFLGTP